MKTLLDTIIVSLIAITCLFLALIVGAVIAVITGIPSVLISNIIFLTFISFLLFEIYLRTIKPVQLIFKGQYERALALLKRNLKSFNARLSRDIKNATIYNLAYVNHQLGRFEDSIEWLDKLDSRKLDKNLKGLYYSLYAANLLMLERDLDIAENYLDLALPLIKIVSLKLSYCYLYLLKNDTVKAKEKLEEYLEEKKRDRNFQMGMGTAYFINNDFKLLV
jgi:tetratricopeptide (TPR) repeat protein